MSSVKKDFISGVFYVSLARYSGLAIQLLISAILARLISPDQFGILAIATVIIAFLNLCADLGISGAVIQNQSLNDKDYDSLFSFTICVGISLGLIFFILSYPISYIYNEKELKSVCQWLCFSIFFYSINIVPEALLLKEKKFNVMAARMLFSQISDGVLAIYFAFIGYGVYALVIQGTISSIIIFTINYSCNRLGFYFRGIKLSVNKIFKFSLYNFLFGFINYFTRNLDKLLVGRYLGTVSLGYYEKSYRLMMLPLQNITNVINPVMLPVFSQMQNSIDKLGERYLHLLKIMALISFPLSIWLFFSSRELILLFFGDQWELAVLPFKVLSLSLCVQILSSTTGGVFLSIGNSKGLFYTGVAGAVFIVTSFFITIFVWRNLFAVTIGFDISLFFSAVCSFVLLFKSLKLPIKCLILVLIKPFILSLILLFVLFVVSRYIAEYSLFLSLIIKTCISLFITLFFIQCFTDIKILNLAIDKLSSLKKMNKMTV